MFLKGQSGAIEWCILEIETPSEELLKTLGDPNASVQIVQIKTEKRKKEFLGSRLALKELFGSLVQVEYDEEGKPYLKDSDWQISITHSGKYVAAARSKKTLGIDIEEISEKLNRTKHKYCSEEELLKIAPEQHLKHLCLHWSAKESAYKAVGNYPFIFDEEFKIEAFIPQEKGVFKLEIKNKNIHQEVNVHYKTIDNYVFTFCCLN